MFECTIGTRPISLHITFITIILVVLMRFILYTIPIFFVLPQYYSISSGVMRHFFFMRIWGITNINRGFLPWPRPCPCLLPQVWDNIAFTSRNDLDPIGLDWWFLIKSSLFCSTTRRHDINLEYFVNLRSQYCCYNNTFEVWNVVQIFSSIFFYVIFFLHIALIES